MPDAKPPPGLQHFTGYLLRRAYVRTVGLARTCVGEGAHLRDVVILSILAEQNGISQRTLADLTHVNQSVIVKLLHSLETRGLVARERAPEDRRSYALRLTAEGKAVLDDLTIDLHKSDAELTRALSTEEKEQLVQLLTRLLGSDPALEVVSLSHQVGYLVSHAHRLSRGLAMEVLGPLDMHPRDLGILTIITADQPCSQNHLAAKLGVSPPAALSFVDELESAGLVGRARNLADRRVHDLTITDQGARLLHRGRQAANRAQAQLVDRLGAQQDEQLRALLRRVIDED